MRSIYRPGRSLIDHFYLKCNSLIEDLVRVVVFLLLFLDK